MKKKKPRLLISIFLAVISIIGISQNIQARVFYKYNIMTGYETVKISLNKSSATVNVGESITLKATVSGTSEKVSWISNNEKIASVKNGKVVGLKTGKTVITAKINDSKATCIIKVKEMAYNPSQFKDYGKLNKLIHCFDPALEVSMYAENKPSRLDAKFMVACSARHTDEKYGKEIEGVDGYGEYYIDEKYVKQECQRLFGKSCSIAELTGNFLFVRREGSKVIVSRWSSPYRTTSEITKIVKKSNLFYQAQVTYTVKSVYTNTVKKQVKTVYTVKKAQDAPYGYYVSGFKFA